MHSTQRLKYTLPYITTVPIFWNVNIQQQIVRKKKKTSIVKNSFHPSTHILYSSAHNCNIIFFTTYNNVTMKFYKKKKINKNVRVIKHLQTILLCDAKSSLTILLSVGFVYYYTIYYDVQYIYIYIKYVQCFTYLLYYYYTTTQVTENLYYAVR